MLFLVALVYLLLCVRLRIQIDVSIDDLQGSVSFCVGAFSVSLRHVAKIARKEHGIGLRLEPVGKANNRKKSPAGQKAVQHVLMPYLREVVRRRSIKRLTLYARLGLGDACETAVAAGAANALLWSLAAPFSGAACCDVRVTPDFAKVCLHVHGRCLFFCQLGDVLFAALKVQRKRFSS